MGVGIGEGLAGIGQPKPRDCSQIWPQGKLGGNGG